MPTVRRILKIAAALAFPAVAAWLWFVAWSPENQIRRHQLRFVQAVAENRYGTYSELVSADYSDRWELDRDSLLEGTSEVARQFFQLQAEWSESSVVVAEDGRSGSAEGTLRLAGRGNPVGQEIISRVNRLAAPFTFHWSREDWRPWSWKLVRVANPDLRIPRDLDLGRSLGF